MSRSRLLVVGAGLLAAGAFLVSLGGGPRALAKGKDEHIRFQPSYAAAVQEAKSRNAVIFATFHKDN